MIYVAPSLDDADLDVIDVIDVSALCDAARGRSLRRSLYVTLVQAGTGERVSDVVATRDLRALVMTASEVSRNFASVLDQAAHGETIVVTRGGKRLATISPAPAANGAALAEYLAAHRGALDDGFADDVLGARDLLTDDDPWSE